MATKKPLQDFVLPNRRQSAGASWRLVWHSSNRKLVPYCGTGCRMTPKSLAVDFRGELMGSLWFMSRSSLNRECALLTRDVLRLQRQVFGEPVGRAQRAR